jgi:aminobenzoyl-glutamate transport protein
VIERVGNKLPHPFMLFVYLALFMILISFVVSLFNVSVKHPGSGDVLQVKSLLSGEGLKFMLTSMLENFTGFKPLGLVLTMMLGIGMAQRVGLFESVIKKTIIKAHKSIITYTVFFIGIMGNIASMQRSLLFLHSLPLSFTRLDAIRWQVLLQVLPLRVSGLRQTS